MSDSIETNTQCRPPNEELGAESCWPSFADYVGGGTILRGWNATAYNLNTYCDDESRELVRDLIRRGYDVLLMHGKVVAVEKDRFHSANNTVQ